MKISTSLGDLIKRGRSQAGLTQAQLAEIVFGNAERKDDISKIESGKVSPQPDTLAALRNALNIDDAEISNLSRLQPNEKTTNLDSELAEIQSDSLVAEPPKIAKHIKWFIEHGRKNKLVVLIALMVVLLPTAYSQREEIVELCCSDAFPRVQLATEYDGAYAGTLKCDPTPFDKVVADFAQQSGRTIRVEVADGRGRYVKGPVQPIETWDGDLYHESLDFQISESGKVTATGVY